MIDPLGWMDTVVAFSMMTQHDKRNADLDDGEPKWLKLDFSLGNLIALISVATVLAWYIAIASSRITALEKDIQALQDSDKRSEADRSLLHATLDLHKTENRQHEEEDSKRFLIIQTQIGINTNRLEVIERKSGR